jgi:hypothetical protein
MNRSKGGRLRVWTARRYTKRRGEGCSAYGACSQPVTVPVTPASFHASPALSQVRVPSTAVPPISKARENELMNVEPFSLL